MNVCKGRLLKKILKSKIEACPVNAGHYMDFKHHISFATDMAANFGCNRFRITPDIVSKLLRAANLTLSGMSTISGIFSMSSLVMGRLERAVESGIDDRLTGHYRRLNGGFLGG